MSSINEFDKWFVENWDYEKSNPQDRGPAKAAWMHQQKRIDNLEAELQRIRTETGGERPEDYVAVFGVLPTPPPGGR